MDRVVLTALLAAAVLATTALIGRRSRAPARGSTTHQLPTFVDRRDFDVEASWLLVVFTAASCGTCTAATSMAREQVRRPVAVLEVELGQAPELHERYAVDAVPTLVLCDPAGAVRGGFLGPPTTEELAHLLALAAD